MIKYTGMAFGGEKTNKAYNTKDNRKYNKK